MEMEAGKQWAYLQVSFLPRLPVSEILTFLTPYRTLAFQPAALTC